MNVKERIIHRINAIDNQSILKEILDFIEAETEFEDVYHLSEGERQRVNEGLKEVDNGNVISQEESEKLISEWLKNQSTGNKKNNLKALFD